MFGKALSRTLWHILPESFRKTIRPARIRVMRRLGLLGEEWQKGTLSEVDFWRMALADGGRAWHPELLAERLDPLKPLQEDICKTLDPSLTKIRILDVGAGPLTNVGKTWGNRTIEIVPVDPLAEEYDGLLAEIAMNPPVRTKKAFAESLTESFEKNTFDLSYASNSLDHALDPLKAIREMLAVTKPGGHVYLWHFRNVGEQEAYADLHQWNFDIADGDMTIGNGKTSGKLSQLLGNTVTVKADLIVWRGSEVVATVIKKSLENFPKISKKASPDFR